MKDEDDDDDVCTMPGAIYMFSHMKRRDFSYTFFDLV